MFLAVKIDEGDKVYNQTTEVVGTVLEIKDNLATIQSGTQTIYNQHLSQLIPITDEKTVDSQPIGLNKAYEQVKEFQIAFNHPVAGKPTPISLDRMTSRKIWEFEEGVEAIHASSSNVDEFNKAVDTLIEGVEKARQKSLKDSFPKTDVDKIVAQGDALTDGTYFLMGDFVELGIKPDKLFDIVQSANMSKLFTDENGNKYAKYREEDGKILKSPQFFPPEGKLKEEVIRQINQSK